GVKPDVTLISAANDLKAAAYTIPANYRLNAVGLDPPAGFVYSHDAENPIIIHTFAGMKRAESKIRNFRGFDVKEIVVAPTGGEYLLRGNMDVAHIKLNFKGEPLVRVEPKTDPDPKKAPDPKVEVKKDPPKIADKI